MKASGGVRVEWAAIPGPVRAAVDEALGARVVSAHNEAGGFSPGLAARCALSDGRRVFVKAVSPDQNPQAPRIHRREAEVADLLPPAVAAPGLLHVHDDGRWVVLVFDEVPGRQPREPWRPDELDLVVPAVIDIGRQAAPEGLQDAVERNGAGFAGWRRFAGGDGATDALDAWTLAHLDALADLEAGWEVAAEGDALVHGDVRADNVLLGADGAVTFVDWPWACRGAPYLDLVFFLPSVGLGSGPRPDDVVERHALFAGDDPDAVLAVAVAVAGFFARSAADPAPPGLPHIRRFQQAQADVAVDWIRRWIEA